MTDMIIVTLRMTVRPDKRHNFMESIRGMLEPTRVERGCISYRLYEDIENKNTFYLVEEWKTRDDFEKHVRTDNYRRLLALMDLLSEPYELRFSTVPQTAVMDLMLELAQKKGGNGRSDPPPAGAGDILVYNVRCCCLLSSFSWCST